jgi:hypothetical protein
MIEFKDLKEGQVMIFLRKKMRADQPDAEGSMIVNGQEIRITLWSRRGKNKMIFFTGEARTAEDFQKERKEAIKRKSDANILTKEVKKIVNNDMPIGSGSDLPNDIHDFLDSI